MTTRRFNIKESVFKGLYYVDDTERKFTFITCNDKDKLISYEKALNKLNDNIKFWKQSALSNASLNDILLNELDIARKHGYTVSDHFKRLMEIDKE